MAQLNLIIETLDEYRLVAKELGERLTPFFAPPDKMHVMRIDIIGEHDVIRESFLQTIAGTMLFNTALIPPANPFEANAYSRETRTSAGVVRQAIIVDSKGLDFSFNKREIPQRTAPGPLFVQNPEYDHKLDTANAAKIDGNTHVTAKIQKYAAGIYGLCLDINLPRFPMQRLEQTLIRKDIITPPRRKLDYVPQDNKL